MKRERERIIELPKIIDKRGNLSFVEAGIHIPFHIARTYWIYDIPGGANREGHAFKQQQELIIALSGSFSVVLNDGKEERTYVLNRSYKALYVPNGMWRSLTDFSTNALCLVISSQSYNEADYMRNYTDFVTYLSTPVEKDAVAPIYEQAATKIPEYNTVFDCTLLQFPIVQNKEGNIIPIHGADTIPFAIERVFYIYDIPTQASRGMHAHKHCHEVLVAAGASFDVELDDGKNKRTITLSSPTYGLHIPPGIWATEKNYSSGAICIVLASEAYDSQEYIHSYDDFIKYRENEN